MLSEVVLSAGQTDPLVVVAVIVGLVVLAGVASVHKLVLIRSSGSSIGDQPPESMTNCSACGARIAREQDHCDYCGESVVERS